MSTSWCDKLASTPVVGFFLDPHNASGASLIDAFAPVLDKLFAGDRQLFNIEQGHNSAFSFVTEEGFQTLVEPTKIAVGFVHQVRARAVHGGPPVAELTSKAAPYTTLLKTVLQKLVEQSQLLPGPKDRSVRRIGIVVQSSIEEEQAPPGIRKFIQHMARPWNSAPKAFAFNITSELGTASAWSDRCIHTIARPEGGDNLVNLSFDWQRTFKDRRVLNGVSALKDLAFEAEHAALKYFEELAEGDRFDADDGSGRKA